MSREKHGAIFVRYIGWLTFLAGATNVCAVVLLQVTITHYTGNISKAAIAVGNGNLFGFLCIFPIILLFFLGTACSGFLFHNQEHSTKKYYAILPMVFGVMIFVTTSAATGHAALLGIISFLMGAQNGIYLDYRGIRVRTTHFSGYLSDAGYCFGAALHGNREEAWKCRFYLLSILLFFAGGVASAILVSLIGSHTLEVIAAIYSALGIYTALGLAVGEKETQAAREENGELI